MHWDQLTAVQLTDSCSDCAQVQQALRACAFLSMFKNTHTCSWLSPTYTRLSTHWTEHTHCVHCTTLIH